MRNVSMKEQLQAVAEQLIDLPSLKQKKQSIDKKKKNKSNDWLYYVHYGMELLKVYFPQSFKSGDDIRPLKKGIKEDLVKRLSTLDIIVIGDKACMVKSLAYYVNTSAYYRNIVEGAMRIDLDGNPVGEVSAEEAKYTIERQKARLSSNNQNHLSHVKK